MGNQRAYDAFLQHQNKVLEKEREERRRWSGTAKRSSQLDRLAKFEYMIGKVIYDYENDPQIKQGVIVIDIDTSLQSKIKSAIKEGYLDSRQSLIKPIFEKIARIEKEHGKLPFVAHDEKRTVWTNKKKKLPVQEP